MRIVPFFVLASLIAPAAHALEADVTRPQTPLVPDEPWSTNLTVQVPCSDALPGATIEWEGHGEHAGIVITGPKTRTVDTAPCLSGAQSTTEAIPISVTGSMAVPGEVPLQIVFEVSLQGREGRAHSQTEVVMAFVGVFDVEVERTHGQAGPQEMIEYRLNITNLGNSRTQFEFRVGADGPGSPIPPDPFILESPNIGVGPSHGIVTVRYATPFENGNNNVREDFTVTVLSMSTKDDERTGQEKTLTLSAHTKGYYVPGPGLFLVVAVFALAARLRKQ